MTDTRKAMTLALEALEVINNLDADINFLNTNEQETLVDAAIKSLKTALAAQDAKQGENQEALTANDFMPASDASIRSDGHPMEVYEDAPTLRDVVASIYVSANGEREMDDWKCELPVGRNLLYAHPDPRIKELEEQLELQRSDAIRNAKIAVSFKAERDAALEACKLVDGLIEHQYTGTSDGMTALTIACDACHDALKGKQ